MTQQEFFNNCQKRWDKKYNAIQIADIKRIFKDENLTGADYAWLYNELSVNHKWLPQNDDIALLLSDIPRTKEIGIDDKYACTPIQQLLRHKDKSCEWLIKRCEYINQKWFDRKELTSFEISFQMVWGDLGKVEPDDREAFKRLIIDQDHAGMADFLKRSTKHVPIDQVMMKRGNKMIPVKEVMKNIFKEKDNDTI